MSNSKGDATWHGSTPPKPKPSKATQLIIDLIVYILLTGALLAVIGAMVRLVRWAWGV